MLLVAIARLVDGIVEPALLEGACVTEGPPLKMLSCLPVSAFFAGKDGLKDENTLLCCGLPVPEATGLTLVAKFSVGSSDLPAAAPVLAEGAVGVDFVEVAAFDADVVLSSRVPVPAGGRLGLKDANMLDFAASAAGERGKESAAGEGFELELAGAATEVVAVVTAVVVVLVMGVGVVVVVETAPDGVVAVVADDTIALALISPAVGMLLAERILDLKTLSFSDMGLPSARHRVSARAASDFAQTPTVITDARKGCDCRVLLRDRGRLVLHTVGGACLKREFFEIILLVPQPCRSLSSRSTMLHLRWLLAWTLFANIRS